MRSRNFRNGVTWSYTEYEAHTSCCFLYSRNGRTNELLEHQKKWTKKYSYRSYINTGVTLHPWIRLLGQNGKIWIPRKNWKLPQNTNMFFQPMSDFYTLIMGLLAHSWFEIMEFSQSLSFLLWHWKKAV